MGSIIELNDTLQLTTEQGFPVDLEYQKHTTKSFTAKDFEGKIFLFKDKPKIRIYQQAPVRNFLVHNIGGKWLYWGLVHVIETTHDHLRQTTSGKFIITHLYTPKEMQLAHQLIDRENKTDYFKTTKLEIEI